MDFNVPALINGPPEGYEDTDNPAYISLDQVRDNILKSMVVSLIQRAGRDLPYWCYQVMTYHTFQDGASDEHKIIHMHVHHQLFWSLYRQQAGKLTLNGSITKDVLIKIFRDFGGLYDNGKNRAWRDWIKLFQLELACQAFDTEFIDYAPAGYPFCLDTCEHISSDARDLVKQRTFSKDFPLMSCWERWIHRWFRSNNDTKNTTWPAMQTKARMWRNDNACDFNEWPLHFEEWYGNSLMDWSLIDESEDILSATQQDLFLAWQS